MDVECVVIGAGVVGLATAKALAEEGREVIILEAADAVGTGISSRNSEVIHAGIYYPHDSLMRRFCVEGRERLYAYCSERGIPHRRCGKLIVATSEEERIKLDGIATRARANGVADIEMLSRAEALTLEPALSCHGALLSPSTGIIDSHALMLAMQGDAEAEGAAIAFNTPVLRADVTGGTIIVETGGQEPATLSCRVLVNAAGLDAPSLAGRFRGLPQQHVPQSYFAKGSYFALAGRSPFSRLIYPVPVPGGLGTHLTLDLNGNARFGPDVEWIDHIDYEVRPEKAEDFARAISRYWPGVSTAALTPAYSGIRPKIVPKGAPAQDFVIQHHAVHGIRGLVNLFGIESPGLTSALAIGAELLQVTVETADFEPFDRHLLVGMGEACQLAGGDEGQQEANQRKDAGVHPISRILRGFLVASGFRPPQGVGGVSQKNADDAKKCRAAQQDDQVGETEREIVECIDHANEPAAIMPPRFRWAFPAARTPGDSLLSEVPAVPMCPRTGVSADRQTPSMRRGPMPLQRGHRQS